jgi:hypothetical protein
MSDEIIRLGIVGAGRNTRERHIPGFQAIPGVELVSVANRSRESGERAAKEFGIAKVYDNWLELVQADDTNAILIGTWPYMHCPITLAALEANKHVLTEARMAMNTQEAQTMLAASCRKPHLITQVVPSPFTFKADRSGQRAARRWLPGQRAVGRIALDDAGICRPDQPSALAAGQRNEWLQRPEYGYLV